VAKVKYTAAISLLNFMSRMSLVGCCHMYLPENCDSFSAPVFFTEKAAGSEGELKFAVKPFDVWLKGVI
jgi:hypothetical protein